MLRTPTCGLRICLIVAMGAPVWVAQPSLASAQTYTACRVPDVGAIYMIGVAGTPSACLDATHVQFSWNEGGQVADGAITASKIADSQIEDRHILPESITGNSIAAGTIRGSDIQNGSIGLFDLQEGSVGPEQLGLEIVTLNRVPTNPGLDRAIVSCPAGKRVVSGGFRIIAATGVFTDDLAIWENGPLSDTQWVVRAEWAELTVAWEWEVYAICIIDGS